MSTVVFNEARGNLWATIARFELDNAQQEFVLVVSELDTGKEIAVREDIATLDEATTMAFALLNTQPLGQIS